METSNKVGLSALILTIVGAINWGLVGLAEFNIVSFLFGPGSIISRIIYCLVGVSGLYLLLSLKKL